MLHQYEPFEISLPDDNSTAILIICAVIYHRHKTIPRQLPVRTEVRARAFDIGWRGGGSIHGPLAGRTGVFGRWQCLLWWGRVGGGSMLLAATRVVSMSLIISRPFMMRCFFRIL